MAHFHPVAAALAYFGMSLFFVLSGFVIQYNYGVSFGTLPLRTATYRFYVARFARLYPLYAFTILVALPSIPTPFPLWVNLSYQTLTQSWFNVQFAMFPPDWSISAEWVLLSCFHSVNADTRPRAQASTGFRGAMCGSHRRHRRRFHAVAPGNRRLCPSLVLAR
jgi:peptidoglycan/LPS O-acetylase OafA/YrhL